MKDNSKKPKTVGNIVSQCYLEEIEKSLPKLNLDSINSIAKTVQTKIDSMEEPFRHIQKVSESYAKSISSMSEMIKVGIVKDPKYEMLEVLREIKNQNKLRPVVMDEKVIIYDTKDVSLNRSVDGRCFSYDLASDGKRRKILDTLINRGTYIPTKELQDILSSPTAQSIAKLVQTFNDYASNTLRLKKIKLIQGKKGSGYRINPKIHIEKE